MTKVSYSHVIFQFHFTKCRFHLVHGQLTETLLNYEDSIMSFLNPEKETRTFVFYH